MPLLKFREIYISGVQNCWFSILFYFLIYSG